MSEMPSGKTIVSGIQPSGNVHIGNYLGAIKQWVALQESNTAYFCIVDQHAITVPYDPKTLQDKILDAAALYIAAGVDIQKSVIFVQSHVQAHTELAWLLSTVTPYGNLTRMTQFKDKRKKIDNQNKNFAKKNIQEMRKKHNLTEDEAVRRMKNDPKLIKELADFFSDFGASLALFSYPVLMAADILLYNANFVPVGDDQKQHLELTRLLARRFNSLYGEIFTVPEAYIPETSARIMSLTDPKKKMSKSDEPKSYIALSDDADTIRKKIGSAVTDTKPVFSFTKSGPAVKNLLAIYQAFSDTSQEAIEQEFEGKGYKEFKEALAETIISALTPLQEKYKKIREEDTELRFTLGRGMHRAQGVANATLHRAKEAMGLL